MYFCEDVELLAWEPGVFGEATFGHQAIVKDAPGTLTGTGLAMSGATLGDVSAGMVALIEAGDGAVSQLVEVVSVEDTAHATVSVLRGRSGEAAVAPRVNGAVKVTVVSFRPQIAAVGDLLLGLVGVASGRDGSERPAPTRLEGFKPAAIFGVLASLYRTLAEAKSATNVTWSKKAFYEGLAQAARQTLSAVVDRDGDGVGETRVWSGVHTLARH